jgi:hypothetical protein
MTGKAAPVKPRRRRKTVLTPPINDPPIRGTGGVWPDIIATVRPLPAGPFDGPQGLGIHFNDHAVVRIPELAAWFNELAWRAGYKIGMVCGTDHFDIWQIAGTGDVARAELQDRGPVGQFLRLLRKYGDFSPSMFADDHARACRRILNENNTAIVEANERVLRLAPPPKRDIGEIVRRCERLIYHDPAPTFIQAPSDLPTQSHARGFIGPTPEPRKEFTAQKPYNYTWKKKR